MEKHEFNKELIERYPYLQPRNVWTGKVSESYDYSYVLGEHDLPSGWFKLFLQMCDEIREPLVEAGCLNEFRFSEIKEKFNTMRCYNFGTPKDVHNIIWAYEYVSQFICQKCGKPATVETQGWYYASYCDDCVKLLPYKTEVESIKFNPIMKFTRYENGNEYDEEFDVSYIWERYMNGIDLSLEEFVDYLWEV